MPTYNDPVADATEAREAVRALAHATRAFPDPADTVARSRGWRRELTRPSSESNAGPPRA